MAPFADTWISIAHTRGAPRLQMTTETDKDDNCPANQLAHRRT